MTDKRDLRVNTFDRYVKRSDRLVLQTYSSCEVPLGCGGAIHRWVDPAQSLPLVLVRDFGDRPCTISIDGVAIANARVDVTVGKHVLAVAFESSSAPLALRVALFYDESFRGEANAKKSPMLTSQDDGLWFGTTTEPSPEWQTSTEPLSGWLALRSVAKPARAKQAYLDRRIDRAASIGLSTKPGKAWVRRVFTLETTDDEWVLS